MAVVPTGNCPTPRGTDRPLCPLCQKDNANTTPLPSPHPQWLLTQCPQCTLVYLRRVPVVTDLADEHSWTFSFRAEADQRLARHGGRVRIAWKRMRKRFLPHRKAEALIHRYVGEGKLLDIGCGSGRLFARLSERIVPMGIEIDRHAAARAALEAQRRGGAVLCTDALSGLRRLESSSIQGVLMCSFLEHEHEPLPVLCEVRRVLRTGGTLIVKVPNYACFNHRLQGWRWPGFRFPDHVNYFTPATLREMVRRSGLEVARFGWRDRLPTSDNMWLVARRNAIAVAEDCRPSRPSRPAPLRRAA